MAGGLEVIVGGKGSGKTARLNEIFTRYEKTRGKNLLYVVHEKTFEESDEKTRESYKNNSVKVLSTVEDLYFILSRAVKGEKAIFVDGAEQFFEDDFVLLLNTLANLGNNVFAAGTPMIPGKDLPYPIIPALLATADDVTILNNREGKIKSRGSLNIITGCMFAGKSTKLQQILYSNKEKAIGFKKGIDDERLPDSKKRTITSQNVKNPFYFPSHNIYSEDEILKILEEQSKSKKYSIVGIDEANFLMDLIEEDVTGDVLTLFNEQNKLIKSKIKRVGNYRVEYKGGRISKVVFRRSKLFTIVDELVKKGFNVFVSGLDTDYRAEPWPWTDLFCKADKIEKLKALCDFEGCGKKAVRTMRLEVVGNLFLYTSYKGETVVVGTDHKLAHNFVYEAVCREHHKVLDIPEEKDPRVKFPALFND